MYYNLLHIAVILALLVKAFSNLLNMLSPSPLWSNVSGISSGVMVVLGIIWAIVFLHGNNFAKIPKAVRIVLPITAVLAVASVIISN